MKTKADGSEWSKWRWLKAGKAYLNRSWSPPCLVLMLICNMQSTDHALNWSRGGCNLPELPLLLNQHPFIFFNGRACILLFTAYQFDLQVSNVLRGVLYIWWETFWSWQASKQGSSSLFLNWSRFFFRFGLSHFASSLFFAKFKTFLIFPFHLQIVQGVVLISISSMGLWRSRAEALGLEWCWAGMARVINVEQLWPS